MGDVLVRLDGKLEVRRGAGIPIRLRFLRGEVAKGVIDLDGIQPRSVVAEKFSRGQLGGIKARLPTGIRPSRRACIKFRHTRNEDDSKARSAGREQILQKRANALCPRSF